MKTISKTLLASTLVMGLSATNAMAAAFPDFTVVEDAYAPVSNTFVADKITGNYVEVATFTPTGPLSGTFDVSIKWEAGQFVADDGVNPVPSQLGGLPGSGYNMYATFLASGTFVTSLLGVTEFTFDPGGSLGLWIDDDQDTTFIQPPDGSTIWGTANTADDVQIADGSVASGFGTLDPTLSTCNPGINCGSFGTTNNFNLFPVGAGFFTEPDPFFNVQFDSGQLNEFTVGGTQVINGSFDVTFANQNVPEPSSIVLLGIGLMGVGAASRKKKA